MGNYDVRRVRIGLTPLIMFTASLIRGAVGTHLTFTIRSFSYAIHFGLIALDKEQDSE